MNPQLILRLRIAFMLGVLLMTLFQLWNQPGSSDQASNDNEPRQYLRPIEQLAPHRVDATHQHQLGPAPAPGRTYKPNCTYVNDQEVGC